MHSAQERKLMIYTLNIGGVKRWLKLDVSPPTPKPELVKIKTEPKQKPQGPFVKTAERREYSRFFGITQIR